MLPVEIAWTGSQDLIYVTGRNNNSPEKSLDTILTYDNRKPTTKFKNLAIDKNGRQVIYSQITKVKID